MADIKDKAKTASLKQTESRIAKVAKDRDRQSRTVPLTTFQGVDADTGQEKQLTNLDCGGEAIAVGKNISGGSFKQGAPVLPRGTEGSTRLDGPPSLSLSLDCGSAGAPKPRQVTELPPVPDPPPDPDDPDAEEKEDIEDEFKDQEEPPDCGSQEGKIVPGTTRYVGKAKIYKVYTGEVKRDANGLFYCEIEERIDENSDEIEEYPEEDTGCISPEEESGAAPLKRCQWFNSTQTQAIEGQGCPSGTTYTGFVEFPEGQYRIMCCTLDDSPSPVKGIGAEWQPGNVSETGAASVDTNYCGTDRASMTWGDGEEVYSENPPISFSRSGSTVTFSDGDGVIKSVSLDEVLTEGTTQSASPNTEYCDGKPKAVLSWDGGERIETLNPPISYSVIAPETGVMVDWGGGDVELLEGETWETSPRGAWYCFRAGRALGEDWLTMYPQPCWRNGETVHTLGDPDAVWRAEYAGVVFGWDSYYIYRNDVRGRYCGQNNPYSYCGSPTDHQFEFRTYAYRVTTDTGDFSERETTTPPIVISSNENYQIFISDSTGEIAAYQVPAEPTGFGITCYDYSIAYQCRNKPICS